MSTMLPPVMEALEELSRCSVSMADMESDEADPRICLPCTPAANGESALADGVVQYWRPLSDGFIEIFRDFEKSTESGTFDDEGAVTLVSIGR